MRGAFSGLRIRKNISEDRERTEDGEGRRIT
jgi:hypothetical protein